MSDSSHGLVRRCSGEANRLADLHECGLDEARPRSHNEVGQRLSYYRAEASTRQESQWAQHRQQDERHVVPVLDE